MESRQAKPSCQALSEIVPVTLRQIVEAASHQGVCFQRDVPHSPPAVRAIDPVTLRRQHRGEDRAFFGTTMPSARPPVATHVLEARPLQGGAQKELVVHRHLVAGIDHSDSGEQTPAPERALVAERHAVIPMDDNGERGEPRFPGDFVLLVDVQSVRERDVHRGVRPKQLGGLVKNTREVDIVRVLPADEIARGPGKPLVEGVALPGIPLTHPVGEPALVLLDDLHAAVARAAVDDQVLEIGIVLVQDAEDGSLQELRLMEGGRHDRDPGAGRCVRRRRSRAGPALRHEIPDLLRPVASHAFTSSTSRQSPFPGKTRSARRSHGQASARKIALSKIRPRVTALTSVRPPNKYDLSDVVKKSSGVTVRTRATRKLASSARRPSVRTVNTYRWNGICQPCHVRPNRSRRYPSPLGQKTKTLPPGFRSRWISFRVWVGEPTCSSTWERITQSSDASPRSACSIAPLDTVSPALRQKATHLGLTSSPYTSQPFSFRGSKNLP